MTPVSLVLCTVPESEAGSLADQLLSDKLVACVNMLGPVTSLYWWQGEREESCEILLLMKTPTSLLPKLRERIALLHSYEAPEVLEFHADSGLGTYMEWVAKSCEQ